jgi:transposase InsO family protein
MGYVAFLMSINLVLKMKTLTVKIKSNVIVLILFFDSGASIHILGNDFTKVTNMNVKEISVEESSMKAVTVDGTKLQGWDIKNILFCNKKFNKTLFNFGQFLYVPQCTCNLLSLHCLMEAGFVPEFSLNEVKFKINNKIVAIGIRSETDNLMHMQLSLADNVFKQLSKVVMPTTELLNGASFNNLGYLIKSVRDTQSIDFINNNAPILSCSTDAEKLPVKLQRWHNIFGHCGIKKLRTIIPQVDKTKKLKLPTSFFCETCQKGKQSRKGRNDKTVIPTVYALGELLHMDICGPIMPESLGNSRFALNIVEEKSRYCFTYVLKTKEGPVVMEKIAETIEKLQTQFNVSVKTLRSDQGTEFTNQGLAKFCLSKGINQQFTNTYSPSQNGTVERLNRTIMDMVRTWLLDSKLPVNLWTELYIQAVYIYNNRPHSFLEEKTPAWCLFPEGDRRRYPATKYLHPIGCKVTMNVAAETRKGKFAERAKSGWYIGIADSQPGIKMWSSEENEICESSHVKVFHKLNYNKEVNSNSDYLRLGKNASNSNFGVEIDYTDSADNGEDTQEYLPEEIIDESYDSEGVKRYRVRWVGYG